MYPVLCMKLIFVPTKSWKWIFWPENYTIIFVNTIFFLYQSSDSFPLFTVGCIFMILSRHICCCVDFFLPLEGPLIWKIKIIFYSILFYSILFYTRLHTTKSNKRNRNPVLTTKSSTCGAGVLFMRKRHKTHEMQMSTPKRTFKIDLIWLMPDMFCIYRATSKCFN